MGIKKTAIEAQGPLILDFSDNGEWIQNVLYNIEKTFIAMHHIAYAHISMPSSTHARLVKCLEFPLMYLIVYTW